MPKKFSLKTVKKRESAHPRSRKAQQLQRAALRGEHLQQKKTRQLKEKLYPMVDRLTWFQLRLDEGLKKCDTEYIDSLVEEYLARFDDQLIKIKAGLRSGRPIPVKLDQLEALKSQERKEYEQAGVEIPDLTVTENVTMLRAWDGTYHSIKLIKLMRFKKPQK